MAKKVLVPIADGSEELEAVTIIDVLRRADLNVTVASVDKLQVIASRGVKLVADVLISQCQGKVYDLTSSPLWDSGRHEDEHDAGQDLTQFMDEAPHDDSYLEDFDQVGELADE